MKHPHDKLIDRLGGTKSLAETCHVSPSCVSQWRQRGIPESRLMYLRLLRPELFKGKAAA